MSSSPAFLDVVPHVWPEISRTILTGVPAYLALVVLLRISGKRTLTKLNVFDLVVTVALGSALGTTIMSKSVGLAEGVTAFVVLAGLQFAITWLSVKYQPFSKLIKAEPRLMFLDGKFLDAALRSERLTPGEIRAAVRSTGEASMERIHAVVLETNGSLSVVGRTHEEGDSSLEGVIGWGERP